MTSYKLDQTVRELPLNPFFTVLNDDLQPANCTIDWVHFTFWSHPNLWLVAYFREGYFAASGVGGRVCIWTLLSLVDTYNVSFLHNYLIRYSWHYFYPYLKINPIDQFTIQIMAKKHKDGRILDDHCVTRVTEQFNAFLRYRNICISVCAISFYSILMHFNFHTVDKSLLIIAIGAKMFFL